MGNKVVKVGTHEIREIEWDGQRVITTAQLADVYETDVNNVQANFGRNQGHFKEKKHYYLLKGQELKEFKSHLTDSQLPIVDKCTSHLYVWTKRGASRHCKILDTEKAWDQFDCLEENYFNPRPMPAPTITYQYPLPAASFESVANLGRLIERVMKLEGACPHEIAAVLKPVFQQAGIDIRECFIKVPAYEQLSLFQNYEEIVMKPGMQSNEEIAGN